MTTTNPVTVALDAALRGDALDPAHTARIIADEVLRQRREAATSLRLLVATAHERDTLRAEVKQLRSGGLLELPRLRGIERRAAAIANGNHYRFTSFLARRIAHYIYEGKLS